MVPGTAPFLIQIVQQRIITNLIMESTQMLCLLALFHLRISFPSTVSVYGGGFRI